MVILLAGCGSNAPRKRAPASAWAACVHDGLVFTFRANVDATGSTPELATTVKVSPADSRPRCSGDLQLDTVGVDVSRTSPLGKAEDESWTSDRLRMLSVSTPCTPLTSLEAYERTQLEAPSLLGGSATSRVSLVAALDGRTETRATVVVDSSSVRVDCRP
jgi:hypothetical protein